MGVINHYQEFPSTVAPSRMFKALVLDPHKVIPKVVPEGIKSAEFIEGDSGVGGSRQTNLGLGAPILDAENFFCKYMVLESDIKFDKTDCVIYDVKIVPSDNGGCVCKMTCEYHSKDGVELDGDDIKLGTDTAIALLKSVEEHLLANPDVCA